MNSASISPKVSTAAAAGAIVTIIVWLLGMLGVEVPGEVGAAAALLIMGGAGYLKRDPLREVGEAVVDDAHQLNDNGA